MTRTVAADELTRLATGILTATGMRPDDAAGMARIVVAADLAGHESCGLRQLPGYVEAVREGVVDPAGRPAVDHDRGALLRVDGGRAFGHVAYRFVTALVVERARRHGICGVAVRRTHYLGRVADFCDLAARDGILTLFLLNCAGGNQVVAPHGGLEPRLATNPLAAGVPRATGPAAGGPHLVLDMATSVVALGALAEHRDRGLPDPQGWMTSAGALRPAGGAKGFGLALLAEALAGALSGAGTVGPDPAEGEQGGFVVGIDVAGLRPPEAFSADLERALDHVRDVPAEPGVGPVRIPGEASAATARRRAADGVPVQDHTWDRLLALAAELGVELGGDLPPR